MLTSTYSLVAIAAEQERSRSMLARLRQHFHNAWKGMTRLDLPFAENLCQRLAHVDNFFRRRKIELYLVPVLRMMGREAETLVAELDALSARAAAMLSTFREQVRTAFDVRLHRPEQVREVVDGYCHTMSCRLDREEQELLPLARRLLSVEDWFSIAAQMLSDGSPTRGRGHRSILLPRGASPAIRRVANLR
ncbi:MAG TPA: hypothetical protein VIM12_10575 [Noviherbaspirillum sp.]|jgi:hemerythrin-like domain-containing protein|uniref:hypothetical protein n=1 Tax=Noviherbaspirillum sp. TaxID=1926288 RepID=UPI002F92B35E